MARYRWFRSATWLSLIAAIGFVALWVGSYRTDIHVGRWEQLESLDKSVYHSRAGVFVGRGQLAYASDYAGDDFYAGDLDLSKLTLRSAGTRWGVFTGDFNWYYYEKDNFFFWGMGSNGSAPYISVGLWWVVIVCLLFPVTRALGRRVQWDRYQVAKVLVSGYVILALMAAFPPLTALVVLVAVQVAVLGSLVVAVSVWLDARRRRRRGLCPVCGYDLRATPDPGGPRLERCPECGTYTSGGVVNSSIT